MPSGVGKSGGPSHVRTPVKRQTVKHKAKTAKHKTQRTPQQVAAQTDSSRAHVAGRIRTDLSLAKTIMGDLHKEVDRVFKDQGASIHGRIHAKKMGSVNQELLQKTTAQREKLDDAAGALAKDQAGSKAAYSSTPVLPESYKDAPGMKGRPWAERDQLNKLFLGTELAATETRYYHATRTRNLKGKTGIMKQGLDPNFGGKGAAKGSKEFEARSQGKVHFAKSDRHAGMYKEFLEKGKHPDMEGRKTDKSKAEVLKLALPADMVKSAQMDPNDRRARTLDQKIDARYIRSSAPNPAPGKLKDWQSLQEKSRAENEAILSNMKPDVRKIFDERFPQGAAGSVEQSRRDTALQLLKQGLRSKPALFGGGDKAFD